MFWTQAWGHEAIIFGVSPTDGWFSIVFDTTALVSQNEIHSLLLDTRNAMKRDTKRRFLLAASLLIGIPAVICVILFCMLYWGLCYGVDPLDVGIEKDGVRAFPASQRMGDHRVYIFVENRNRQKVAVDLIVSDSSAFGKTVQLRTVLGPLSAKRIYPETPKKAFGVAGVMSLSITKL